MRIPALLVATFLVAALAVVMTGPELALGTSICKEKKDECFFDSGKAYPTGTSLEASSTNPVFKGDVVEECETSTLKAATAAEVGKPLGGELKGLSFGSCEPCDSVTVEKLPHSETLEAAGGGKGTLSTAVQVAFAECPFGINCVYGAKAVTLAATSEPALLIAGEEELARKLGSETLCGAAEKWSGEYEITAPKPLWVANTASGTALCKESTDKCPFPSSGAYPAGTKVLATDTGANPILKGTLNEQCEDATVELTTSAEAGKPLAASLVGLTETKNCKPCTVVTVEGLPAPLEIEALGGGKGSVTMTGVRVKMSKCAAEFTCTFSGSFFGDVTSEPPALVANETSFKLESGSKILCGETGKFIATFSISAPSPFWLSSKP